MARSGRPIIAGKLAYVHMVQNCQIKLQSPAFLVHQVSSCQPKGCMDLLRFPRTTFDGASGFLAQVSGLNPPVFATCLQEAICSPQPRIVYGFGWSPTQRLALSRPFFELGFAAFIDRSVPANFTPRTPERCEDKRLRLQRKTVHVVTKRGF